jgi:hypothetical protein
MNFNDHYAVRDKHAFLSASNYHWINYDVAKLERTYASFQARQRGTDLHKLAEDCIRLNVRLPDTKKAIDRFVNDAITFRMSPEVVLFYSEHAFGTADAVGFRDNFLRIHDLKTGVSKASMAQLLVYAAYFCLEYAAKPEKIQIELRIYQGIGVEAHRPDPSEVRSIMRKVIEFDKRIQIINREV